MAYTVALSALKRFRAREFAALERTQLSSSKPQPPTPSSFRPQALSNPFVPQKNEKTGRWVPPKYSRRHQADLVKQARLTGRLDLLPPGPKYDPSPLTGPPVQKEQLKAVKKVLSADANQTSIVTASGEALVEEAVADAGGKVVHLEESATPATATGDASSQTGESASSTTSADDLLSTYPDNSSLEPWERPIDWTGNLRRKWVPGADIGARLYAGKKRMFKGHAWERTQLKRKIRVRILMHDMRKRIKRYKTWHALRRPKPLKPAPAGGKAKKLPF